MLCCVVLCCVVLCCVLFVLHCGVCCFVLCCVVFCERLVLRVEASVKVRFENIFAWRLEHTTQGPYLVVQKNCTTK